MLGTDKALFEPGIGQRVLQLNFNDIHKMVIHALLSNAISSR